MKKITLLFTLSVISITGLYAQPTLKNVENFKGGEKALFMVPVLSKSMNHGNGGANVTWDFSKLPNNVDTLKTTIFNTSKIKEGKKYPLSNLVEVSSDSSYIYMNVTNDTVSMYGYSDHIGGTTLSFSNPYTYVRHSLTYMDSVIDKHIQRTTNSNGTTHGSGKSRTIADGYGTLILGNKTYTNVLRVVFYQDVTDTTDGTHYVVRVRTISHAWFDNAHKFSLLKIDSTVVNSISYNDTTKDIRYLVNESAGINSSTDANHLLDYYMANNQLFISGNFSSQNRYTVNISNALGQTIYTDNNLIATGNKISLPLNTAVSSGIYLFNVSNADGDALGYGKLFIQQ